MAAAIITGYAVWLSFLAPPKHGQDFPSIFPRLLVSLAAGGGVLLIIDGSLPGRDARGIVWAFAFGLLAWRLTAVIGRLRSLRLVIGFTVGLAAFFGILRGWPQGWGWLTFLLSLFVCVWVVFVRRVPGVPGVFALYRPVPQAETRNPVEFTSDDGARLVDAVDLAFGSTRTRPADNPDEEQRQLHRANNAPGSFATGHLEVCPDFRSQGPPALFRTDQLSVTARFSNVKSHRCKGDRAATHRDDAARDVRGLALRFAPDTCGEGESMDMVSASETMDMVFLDINRFIVRSRADMLVFLRLLDQGRRRRYAGIGRLVIFGRTTASAIAYAFGRKPKSYLGRTYHGIHAFWWTIGDRREPVRYLLTPSGDRGRSRDVARDRHHRLDEDLEARARGATFRLVLVRGEGLPEHRLLDAARPWPRNRPRLDVGTVRLERYVPEGDLDHLGFNPHHLPIGVEPSDDEVLMARRAAYPEGHARRRTKAEEQRQL